jgi:hypothetical protein
VSLVLISQSVYGLEYGMDDRGVDVRFLAAAQDFSRLQSVLFNCGGHLSHEAPGT